MRFGIGPTIAKAATTMRTFGVQFLKDNLKLFFDFQNTDLEHVGTGSLDFDDDDEQVVRTGITNTNFGKAITISAWVTFGSAQGNRKGLFGSKYYANNEFSIIQHDQSSNEFYLILTTKNGSTATFTNVVDTEDKWIHLTFVVDQNIGTTNNCKLYKNGVLSSTTHTGSSGDIECTQEVAIGMINYTAFQTTGNAWDGKIAKVGFWTRALNASEVQNIVYKSYSDLKGSEKTHLRNWWDLDDISSTTAPDSHGSDNGTLQGTSSTPAVKTIYGNGCPVKPRGVDNSKAALADQIGSGSASFDGDDDYIDCGLIDFDTNDVSIVAWYKANAFDDPNAAIVNNRDSNTGTGKKGIQIRVDSGGDDIELFTDCGSTTFSTKTDSFVPVVGVWTHVAATIDRSALQSLYIDGVLQATTDISGQSSADITNADNFVIGRDEGSNFFNGNIAQVGVWVGRVLTQEEIQEISQKQYSELTTSEKTNIVSWWGLDSLHGQNAVEDKNGTESLGSEIVVNGEFTGTFDTTQDYSSDFDLVTGWRVHTAGSGGSPHTATEGDNNGSQAVRIISTSSLATNYINVRSRVAFELTAGTLYKLTFDAKKESTSTFMRIKTAIGSNIAYQAVAGGLDAEVTLTDTMTTYTYYFIPTVTDTDSYIAFGRKSGDSASNFTIDNISLKIVTGSNVGVLL